MSNTCYNKIILPEDTVRFLRNSLDNNKVEVSGNFLIDYDHNLDCYRLLQGDIFKDGMKDKAVIVKDRTSFHTHPKEAYIKYQVKYGIPSNYDYVAFLKCYCDENINTIFHIVSALEGLYVISMSEDYTELDNMTKQIKNFVMDKFGEDAEDDMSIPQYAYRMSSIKYKKKELFNVCFIDWKNAVNTIFEVLYKKVNGKCDL